MMKETGYSPKVKVSVMVRAQTRDFFIHLARARGVKFSTVMNEALETFRAQYTNEETLDSLSIKSKQHEAKLAEHEKRLMGHEARLEVLERNR